MATRGYLAVVLHAHLPFVRHPEHPDFLEERWLFEAISECYLPLLAALGRVAADHVPGRIALSISPALGAMLEDPLLRARYRQHLARLLDLAAREVTLTRGGPEAAVAQFHRDWLERTQQQYEALGGDLLAACRTLRAAGVLELLTTTATHGFLPLLKTHAPAVRAQLAVGAEFFRRTFGPTRGLWLPECAFYPGLESELRAQGFSWFVVDTHGLHHASHRPQHGVLAPIACPNGVAAFGRDPDSSRQVWSAQEGYPGDFFYREFHRDIAHQRSLEHLGPCLLDGAIRVPTGLKYWRVTGSDEKALYEPERAQERVREHARHFVAARCAQLERAAPGMDRPPLALAPYDAELFGHWWFEGPQFLEQVLREAAAGGLELLTPSDYLDRHPVLQCATPGASSWGWQGYHECWLNGGTEWIYPHLHQAARVMTALADRWPAEPPGGLRARALNQAARSLLLAQASDWPFLIKCGTAVDYASRRVREQLARFHHLAESVTGQRIDERTLRALEAMDNAFPWLDYRAWRSTEPAVLEKAAPGEAAASA